MHGLIFETSIWQLAGSTRYLALDTRAPTVAVRQAGWTRDLASITCYTEQLSEQYLQYGDCPTTNNFPIRKSKIGRNTSFNHTESEDHHRNNMSSVDRALNTFQWQAPTVAVKQSANSTKS